jgi:hypothetical protein
MLYKHNESRRHKIEKISLKVTNLHDYNNGLRIDQSGYALTHNKSATNDARTLP